MKLTIHRGTKEIGGSCVELRTANNRILIDFGIPLVTSEHKPFDINLLKGKTIPELKSQNILPDIKGLYKDEKKGVDGILISHSHLDHYGFLHYVNLEIPIYLSQGASQLIEISNIFIPTKVGKLNTRIINHKKQLSIGDFTINPFLVDHSAFDAFAFLIEAEGKRLFYSGDFRGHGRKRALFKRIIENPPKDIDCLLMEGSMLGRTDEINRDESVVEDRIQEILSASNNITFLFVSSQNIDRLVSAYRACLKTGKIFVLDIYTAFILDKLRKISKHIPQFNWKNIRVKFLKSHADALVKTGYRDLLYAYNKRKIDLFEINRKKKRILMLARDNSAFPLIVKKIEDVKGAKIIYSMWEGYLKDDFLDYCKKINLEIEKVHTSGHATVEDLRKFAKALNPKKLIPIHTFEPKAYPRIFENVEMLKDGKISELNSV